MPSQPSRFRIGATDFLLDEQPFRIISGSLHYPRIHPEQWRDRVRKARLMGLNTIETYVPWNAHEPIRGSWIEEGPVDLGRFLDIIAEEGMYAIVRPGPYVCAEWHNGGLPTWLTAQQDLRLRSSDPRFLEEVTAYLDRVNAIIKPRQIDHGGAVILVQIENEYGAYGSDKEYLAELIRVTRAAGITVPLTQVDQPIAEMLENGSAEGLHKTGSFGGQIQERLDTLREHQPTGPLMCMEFWCGWFDHWGEKHHTTSAAESAANLELLLATGASVNIYMVHGGTNFGLTAGANDSGRYLPMVTSYDYDAPISESGDLSEKFHAFRDVISRYAPVPEEPLPRSSPAPTSAVALRAVRDVLDAVCSISAEFDAPPTLDALEPNQVLAEYRVKAPTTQPAVLDAEIRDIAWVSRDDTHVGTLQRTLGDNSMIVPAGNALTLLVEETGRVNYDEKIGEAKGVIGTPRLNGTPMTDPWTVRTFDVSALGNAIMNAPADSNSISNGRAFGPRGFRGHFSLEEPNDLFLDTAGWGKGYAWINGFFLGRYWRRGPQRTLYVPEPVTRSGENDIAIFEFESMTDATAKFVARPNLGHEVE